MYDLRSRRTSVYIPVMLHLSQSVYVGACRHIPRSLKTFSSKKIAAVVVFNQMLIEMSYFLRECSNTSAIYIFFLFDSCYVYCNVLKYAVSYRRRATMLHNYRRIEFKGEVR